MGHKTKIIGITWALFTVGLSLGYTLGVGVDRLCVYSRFEWLATFPPIIACIIIYWKLTNPLVGDSSSDTTNKQKNENDTVR